LGCRLFGNPTQPTRLFVAPAFLLKLMLGERAELLLGGQKALPTNVQVLGYDFQYAMLEEALKAVMNSQKRLDRTY